jgi:hypothetical protein
MNKQSNEAIQNETTRAILALSLGTNRDDVVALLNDPQVCAFVGAVLTPEQVSTLNQKGAYRMLQAFAFALHGGKHFNRVTAMLVTAVAKSTQAKMTFGDLRFLAGELHADGSHIAGVPRQKLHRYLAAGKKSLSVGTIRSQVSRTVADRGLFSILGVTHKSETKKGEVQACEITATGKAHPLITAYAAQLDAMSDGALEILAGGSSSVTL